MNTLNYKFKIILVIMLLEISFSVGATVESDAVQAAKGKTKEQVAAIVKAAARANPALAASIALAVVKSQPAFAAAIAAAAAAGAPANAAAIVTAIVKEVPKYATVIAKEVVSAVPSKAGAITNAAVKSAPDAAVAITEAVVTQILFAAPPVAQPSTARSESTTNNISVTQNVITTNLENKITACGTDSQCKVNASVSAVQASGSTNATLLGLLASAIIIKVQQITNDKSLINNIKDSTLQAAASAS